jgi:2-phospho-L-lactate guanylyltransferase
MAQAIIAVRGGPAAKSRCAGVLGRADRAALTAVMLEDMLAAIAQCPSITQVWVVTPTPDLAALAERTGARALRQPRPAGLNPAIRLAVAEVAETAPYEPLLILPGDLPMVNPGDLEASLLLLRSHAVVLGPTLDGGTGLIGLRAGAHLSPRFGGRSFQRHADTASRARLPLAVLGANSLSWDVDDPKDLAGVLEHGPATRTAAFLRERLKPSISPRIVR